MTDPLFDLADGNTAIDEDEALGLRLSWVRTRGDLNEAEAANIAKARRAIRSPSLEQVTDDLWLRRLHRLMFGDVWSWAGTYRTTNRNIGIEWSEVTAATRALGQDCRVWSATDSTEMPTARFHHRLVSIHPFANGNGRHARAAADYLCMATAVPPPSWGANTFATTAELRTVYLNALRTADREPEDLQPLIAFMWS